MCMFKSLRVNFSPFWKLFKWIETLALLLKLQPLIPLGFEPRTSRVLGERDNHYTMESALMFIAVIPCILLGCSVILHELKSASNYRNQNTPNVWLVSVIVCLHSRWNLGLIALKSKPTSVYIYPYHRFTSFKIIDEDGIRTHAGRAQWISSPSP